MMIALYNQFSQRIPAKSILKETESAHDLLDFRKKMMLICFFAQPFTIAIF
jgi:hypothetical protein